MTIMEKMKNLDYGSAMESDKEALAWIAKFGGKFDHYIGGKWVKPKGGKYLDATNPATTEKLATFAKGNAADIDAAVKAAGSAKGKWAALSGHSRAKYLYALARLLQKHSRLFAVLETLDNGKPIRESRDADVPLAARHFYHHAGWAQLSTKAFDDYEPYGVVGQIIPWNFPLLMLAWKIAPALAAGNVVVLKPAEYTSLSALLFAEICSEAGLPDGVVNIVTGLGAEAGEALIQHKDVKKIAFTGSTNIGRHIRTVTANTDKGLSLELGGKSPFIVYDDADIDAAVEGVVNAIFFNQGEVCCAGSRLLLQEPIAERFLTKLRTRLDKFIVGNPMDKNVDMGAIVDPVQHKRINDLLRLGVDEGATMWQSGCEIPKVGSYVKPTIFTDVSPTDAIVQDEIFGPVLVVMTFRTNAEAEALANNTKYGLSASVWSENVNQCLDIAPKIKAGVVWVNSTNQFDAAVGFGGYRESGYGREGGMEGMHEYLKPKYYAELKKLVEPKAKNVGEYAKSDNVDRTPKLYIGGKQARPDNGHSLPVVDAAGEIIAEVPHGSRKDIRNAVQAAAKAKGWAGTTAHLKAQILYYIAENLDIRKAEFANRIASVTNSTMAEANAEVEQSVSRLFTYAAWADKYDGKVHNPPTRAVAIAMNEAIGVVGISCPNEAPLLGFISLVAPAIAMGNTVVAIASETAPLLATDFYQILETSDLPAGVLNIITGPKDELTKTLAEHDEVDAIWYFGAVDGCTMVKAASVHNLKQVWTNEGKAYPWHDANIAEGETFLRKATQVKNIWVPYGV
ncbi:MAG: aldehyde dehydrogenase family protein [Alphaproteobacteria bacterium]|nr:aldehyde dehydrogenase family protein [Alphaproteobacteria bacterium]